MDKKSLYTSHRKMYKCSINIRENNQHYSLGKCELKSNLSTLTGMIKI